MTNPTIDHPLWGAIEVLQDGGSWILCQVGESPKKLSKKWLRDQGVSVDHLFKEPEPPTRKPRPLKEVEDEEDEDSEEIDQGSDEGDDWTDEESESEEEMD